MVAVLLHEEERGENFLIDTLRRMAATVIQRPRPRARCHASSGSSSVPHTDGAGRPRLSLRRPRPRAPSPSQIWSIPSHLRAPEEQGTCIQVAGGEERGPALRGASVSSGMPDGK